MRAHARAHRVSGKKALVDAGLDPNQMPIKDLDPGRCGILIGTAMGGMNSFSNAVDALSTSGALLCVRACVCACTSVCVRVCVYVCTYALACTCQALNRSLPGAAPARVLKPRSLAHTRTHMRTCKHMYKCTRYIPATVWASTCNTLVL